MTSFTAWRVAADAAPARGGPLQSIGVVVFYGVLAWCDDVIVVGVYGHALGPRRCGTGRAVACLRGALAQARNRLNNK
jgi:hypothetical protein